MLTAVAAVAAVLVGQAAPKPPTSAIPNDGAAIRHALGRLGYGARPGDVERVRALGLSKWMDQQLGPERIDDSALEGRLARFETLRLSARDIARDYYLPVLMERRERREEAQSRSTPETRTPGARVNDGQEPMAATSGDPAALPAERTPATEAQRRARQVIADLSEQKILRAVYSERQLEEVMTDFWFNHFNVFAGKNVVRGYVTEYERDVIRPHALGKFRDLLGATSKSPAMLVYLDNWLSMDPNAPDRRGRMQQQNPRTAGGRGAARLRGARSARQEPPLMGGAPTAPALNSQGKIKTPQKRGINENYARELMELHTVGVDGGYTQQDIVEVARAFTGWTVQDPRQGGGFLFRPAWHDDREKHVLGQRIAAGGGMRDGEQVLDLLAAHPSTAKFIATKLARRFVSDTPPESLVARAAARFEQTGGDIREVVRDDRDVAGVLRRIGAAREGEDAARVRGQRAEDDRRDRDRCAGARREASRHGNAALLRSAADWLQGRRRCLGEQRRAPVAHELRAGAG